jgi:hypothetical protein
MRTLLVHWLLESNMVYYKRHANSWVIHSTKVHNLLKIQRVAINSFTTDLKERETYLDMDFTFVFWIVTKKSMAYICIPIRK